MKRLFLMIAFITGMGLSAVAQTVREINICEKNTDKSYKVYNTAISITSTTTVRVKTSRYTDFYPTISGRGNLEMYCGGERTYLGNHSDKSYPSWASFSGKVDIFPYKEVDGSCGFYGAIMNNNGKSYSPEDTNPSGKINTMLSNNKVTLHEGAAFATEKSATAVRIGELNTEVGSRMYGYYKSQSSTSSAYYLIGGLNTDATLAGRIASIESKGNIDSKQTVGIIKEGTGTYVITGNDNQISGAIRVNAGTILVNNDATKARTGRLTGGTGTAADASMPVAYVFNGGTIGGTGNIGGHVDLYGTMAPGAEGNGTLHLANYATAAACNLTVHPSSVIRCSITDSASFTTLDISGKIFRSTMTQSFTESTAAPLVVVALTDSQTVKVGDSFTILRASKGRDNAGVWFFKIVLPSELTWSVIEKNEDDGSYTLTVKCTSLNTDDSGNTDTDEGDDPTDQVDEDKVEIIAGLTESFMPSTLNLRKYLENIGSEKRVGVAIPSYWKYDVAASPSSALSKAISNNFNLCVTENEMKMDALEGAQGSFNYYEADKVVTYAKNNKMDVRGHTLVWHSQVPEWISKDGKNNDKKWTRQQLLDIMKTHITNIVRHFGTNVCEWDVVNETLDDDQSIVRSNPNGYQLRKESVWVKVIGEDFIDSAFVYAHRANPKAKLYLNDYGVEYTGDAKTAALYNLAKRLKDSGIPIDGVGLQCHLNVNNFNKQALSSTVKRYAGIGLNCIFTEIDIAVYNQTTSEFNKQADIYRQIAEVFLKNDNCPRMVVWGITDQHSWIADRAPLLFDNNVSPKSAYFSVQKIFRHYAADYLMQKTLAEDINQDGVVDTQDVLAIYQFIQSSGSVNSTTPEDANGDGTVDTQDVLCVYDYMQSH